MELLIEIITYIIVAILIGIAGAWIYLIKSMIESFTKTPYLDKFENTNNLTPKVSIILPARNEEKYLAKCLDSLIDQDYENYEIVVIDDSSEDSTGEIISKYAKKNSKIIHVSANSKPEGWMGKNWACMEGIQTCKRRTFTFYRCRYKAFKPSYLISSFTFTKFTIRCTICNSKIINI